jgi:hypothetical protein
MKTPISILSPAWSHSYRIAATPMPPARNASVSIASGGFRRFPASFRRVSAGPVFNEPAQTPPRQALEIVDESSGRILGGEVSALPALSAGHFRFDQ